MIWLSKLKGIEGCLSKVTSDFYFIYLAYLGCDLDLTNEVIEDFWIIIRINPIILNYIHNCTSLVAILLSYFMQFLNV
jgi:hypothetical protein